MSRSARAGLTFPVGRVHRYLREGRYAARVSSSAPIFMAAVLEYLTIELLELAGNAARERGRKRIMPRHILLAIRTDAEFFQLLGRVTVTEGGVPPNIQKALLPPKKPKHGSSQGGSHQAMSKTATKSQTY